MAMLVTRLAVSPGRHGLSVPKMRYSHISGGVSASNSSKTCSIGALRRSTGSTMGARDSQTDSARHGVPMW